MVSKATRSTAAAAAAAPGPRYSYALFHVVFGCASMHIAMLLTRWGDIRDGEAAAQVNISKTVGKYRSCMVPKA